ncbi:MAG TPA: HD domain-containing phosphohydrolase [bacterium]
MLHNEQLKKARILIVDDQEANVYLLERILRGAGFSGLKGLTDSREVPTVYSEFRPDLLLLDLHMPHQDGFAVLEALKALIPAGAFLPILVLTADITPQAKQRALSGGAKDFLTKPFDPAEVLLRIENLLETRFLHLELRDHNQLLEQRVGERTKELEEAHFEMLERLAVAGEFRDDQTGQHTRRVGETAARLARTLGLARDQVELIRHAAPLHDVGKIGIPDNILLKPGPLTPEEFEVIKTHTTIGARILSGGKFPLLQMAEEIALSHHERWDGKGYPRGLRGEAIPLPGRIVALADVFDAVISKRPYKKARSPEEAAAELQRGAGTQFDPRVVEAFLARTPDPPQAKDRLQVATRRPPEP